MDTGLFTFVSLEQQTPEWLEWRLNGIGASDAPTIMGQNPWKSRAQLLNEKRASTHDSYQNDAMARGVRLEPEARKLYIERTGREVSPACLQSRKFEWLRASVDGITDNGSAVVEIKCGESVYQKAAQNRRVPFYYDGQLQHILAVTGLASIDFWCYLPGRPEILLTVPRNEQYIRELITAELDFWARVMRVT